MNPKRGKRNSHSPGSGEGARVSPERKTPSPPYIVRTRHHVKEPEQLSEEEMEREQARLQQQLLQQQQKHEQMLQASEEHRLPEKQQQQSRQLQRQPRAPQQQPKQGPAAKGMKSMQRLAFSQGTPTFIAIPSFIATPTFVPNPTSVATSTPIATPTSVATLSNAVEGPRPSASSNPDEVTIKVRGIPNSWSLLDMYTVFEKYGTIVFIEFFDDQAGNRDGGGKVKFRYDNPFHDCSLD